MSKVLLINPAEFETKYTKAPSLNRMVFPPLGLAYIAAVLEENGHKVSILDAPPLQIKEKQLMETVRKTKPDIVGIQAYTSAIYQAKTAAECIKQEYPDTTVVFGGHHPTFMPDDTLKMSKSIDYLVRGEGEYTFLKLTEALENGTNGKKLKDIKGISFRSNGAVVNTPDADFIKDLDALPFPARHLLPMDEYHYFGARREMQSLLSSRGCPFKCRFCAVGAYYKNVWRPRSAKNVVDEMEQIREKFGIRAIAVMDDMATFSKRRIRNICQDIRERDLDIYWGTVSRVDTMDFETLKLMAKSRCLQVLVGVESGSERVLQNSHKGISLQQIEQFFIWCKKLGMDTVASVVFGLPGDTKESLQETLWFIKKLNPGVAVFSAATPYPGTPFWDEAKQNGWLPKETKWSDLNMYDPVLNTNEITKEELEDFIQFAYLKFRGPKWGMQRLYNDFRYTQKIHGFLGAIRVPPLTVRLFVRWFREKSRGKTFDGS
ncbi:MAG: cobalamin-dependent protein [Thermoplasmata archaeon]|nr:MAG: cobalamin-dependent protein [Thermoplasmata archaeon]